SDFYEAQNGKVEARAHGSSAFMPEQPNEWVIFQELGQMESTYRLKLVSPIGALPMLLLGGEGRLLIQGGQVSLLDGWVKFQADEGTASQVQRVRASLQSAFQNFCANPDHIPNAQTMAFLDQ
ncbi:unnamed protein product, partial [Symbiodinium pilosum]